MPAKAKARSRDESDLRSSGNTDHSSEYPTSIPLQVIGNSRNFVEFGLPSERGRDERISYYFYPTWRSQIGNLFWFVVTAIFAVAGSQSDYLDWSVIPGRLFSTDENVVMLHLPLLVFVPGFFLGQVPFTMYNARYIIDEGGVEGQIGLVSMYLRQPRLRFEDIRGVEPEQSLLERILGIGRVLVGSAMTADVEIVMEGVADPRAIQLLINKERDRRLESIKGHGSGPIHFVTGD